jgi:hypothetical protein
MADLGGIGKYMKSLAGPVGSAVDSLTSLKVISDIFFDVDEKASSIVKKFGQGRDNILSIKQNMTEAYQEVAKMGGSFDDIYQAQMDIAGVLNRAVVLSKDSYKEFYAMQQVTNQSLSTIIEKFKDAGFSVYQAGSQMQKVVDTAREIGVSVEDVSSKVLANMDYINKYNFQGGVEGLAKMAAQASTLRINMRETLGFADKVFNPEGAIETAAALQRLGVTQAQLLDPLRLMNLAQNDPTELQNQIVEMTKSFVKLGESGNFEIMPGAKRRFMEISKAMGISYNELTKMALGSAELDDKMKKIKFPDADQFASKETRQLIANLAEKGKDGEYKIKFTDEKGKTVEKNITELNEKDVELLKQPPKKMEELAVDQLSTLRSIEASIAAMSGATGFALAGTKTGEDILMAEKELYSRISTTFTKAFDVKEISQGLDKGLQGMFQSILDGDGLKGFMDAGQEMFNLMSSISTKFSDETSKQWEEFMNSENMLIQVFTKLGEQAKQLGEGGLEVLNKKLTSLLGGGSNQQNQGQSAMNQGQSAMNQGQSAMNQGQSAMNQGQSAMNQGQITTSTTSVPPPTTIKAEDFAFAPSPIQTVKFPDVPDLGVIQTLPQDTIEIRGGTKTNESFRDTSQQSSSNFTINVNVSVNGGNISRSDIEKAMQDSTLIQTIKTELGKINGQNNNNQPDKIRKDKVKEKFR